MDQRVSRMLADITAALEATHPGEANLFRDLHDELEEDGYLQPNVRIHGPAPLSMTHRIVRCVSDAAFERAVREECRA